MAYKEMKRIIEIPAIINIDQTDFDLILDGGELGYFSKKVNEAAEFNVIGLPNYIDDIIVYVESDVNLTLHTTESLLTEIRTIKEDLNIIYGTSVNETLNDEILVSIFYKIK